MMPIIDEGHLGDDENLFSESCFRLIFQHWPYRDISETISRYRFVWGLIDYYITWRDFDFIEALRAQAYFRLLTLRMRLFWHAFAFTRFAIDNISTLATIIFRHINTWLLLGHKYIISASP